MTLQHETLLQPVEEIRVTSNDLARALAAIESRRQAQAERDTDTIALGEAIRQLGLDVTAEELLAEIRAQRETEAAAAEDARQRTDAARKLRATRLQRAKRAAKLASLAALLALALALPLAKNIAPIRAAPAHPWDTVNLADDINRDGTAAVDLDTIRRLSSGTRAETIWKDKAGRLPWLILSVDGQLYVHAWRGPVHSGRMRVFSQDAPYAHIGLAASDMVPAEEPRKEVEIPVSSFRGVPARTTVDRSGGQEVVLKGE